MVCYAVPVVAGLIHFLLRRKIPAWKRSTHQNWLTFLFLGGSVFGIVDHWWNGELFLVGENIMLDIVLGIAITAAIIVTWAIIITLEKLMLTRKTVA